MTTLTRLPLLFALLAGIVAGPVIGAELEPDRGLGGTGHAAEERGIGGTGRGLEEPGSGGTGLGGTGLGGTGLGGTGLVADGGTGIGGTGLIGTIAAFGSIWVNGEEIHYGEDQPVGIYDRSDTPRALQIGQVVEVEADERQGQLVARRIEVRHAVAGTIDAIDRSRGEMVVLGQRVELPDDESLARLRVGERVAVSGLRDDQGRVVASLLETPPEGVPAFVRGPAERVEGGRLRIGGAEFDAPDAGALQALGEGREVTLYGRQEGGRLRATRMRLGEETPFAGRVKRLSVEGFVGAQGRRVGGLRLPEGAAALKPGQRMVIDGAVDDHRQLRREGLKTRSSPYGGRKGGAGGDASAPRGPHGDGAGESVFRHGGGSFPSEGTGTPGTLGTLGNRRDPAASGADRYGYPSRTTPRTEGGGRSGGMWERQAPTRRAIPQERSGRGLPGGQGGARRSR